MVVPRPSLLSRSLGRTVLRRVTPASRSSGWKHVGRRTYASGHGEQQSSELPWIIGSIAVTVPAAGWLLQQGPTKSDHGHEAHGDQHHEEGDEKAEIEKEDGGEEDSTKESEDTDNSDEGKQEDDDKSDDDSAKSDESEESNEGDKSEDSKKGESDYPQPKEGSPGQINWKPGMNKGPGEGQKGERKPSETKGEKDSQGTSSGAKHPYLDDPEKSKKGIGITDTAKIHGTVDSRQDAR